MTKQISLNFDWRYKANVAKFINKDSFISSMDIVDIPHSNVDIPLSNFDERRYQIQSVYYKTFQLDKISNRKYFIKFYGVGHHAKVYMNQTLVGEHYGGYTSFELDVTNEVVDGLNQMVVEVDARETLNVPPFGKTIDYLTFGGIYREVYLIEKPQDYIVDVDIHTKDLLTEPKITLDVKTHGGQTIDVLVEDKDGKVFQNKFNVGQDIQLDFKPKLWSIKTPHMYQITLTLDGLDIYQIKTGFREIEFKKYGFYLNGDKVKIHGLNRHQTYPYVGYAMPKSGQVADAKLLKETCNAVRTSHYPQSKYFIDACDDLGLLVFTEAPGWQHVGDDEWQKRYLEQIKEMIDQYKYHPSIILWGVRVNESGDYDTLYKSSNDLARSLDDRPTGGVRCINYSNTFEDVYTYNDFIHNGTNTYLKPIDQVLKTDHPYLITEFMGHMFPTKIFDSPHRVNEHTLRYTHIMNSYFGEDRISGAFGWQFIDYYTHKEFGSGDKICYHGVYDMFRLPKPAAKVYQSQLATKPYLEVLNYMDIGDYNAGFVESLNVASNCEEIKLYQNDRLVSTFKPRYDLFPNLPHPIYMMDNLYGDAYKAENMTKEEFNRLASLANEIAKRGGLDKVLDEENANWEDIQKGWQLYGKYIANWGSDTFTYTLVGTYKGEEIVKKVGPYTDYTYDITIDKNTMVIEDTYDVAKIDIFAKDNLGNIRNYCFDSFLIETTGSLEVIGDQFISLIGGQRSFWVRTKGLEDGTITIKNDRMEHTIKVNIIKK